MIEAADYFFQVGWRLVLGTLFLTITVFLAGTVRRMIRGWKLRHVEAEPVDAEVLEFVKSVQKQQLRTAKEAGEELERFLRERGYATSGGAGS